MWETILQTKNLTIQSRYHRKENSPLGEMEYRLTSTDDETGKNVEMMISPHDVINILVEVRERELSLI